MKLETLITYLENNNFVEITTSEKNIEKFLYKKNKLCIFAASSKIEIFENRGLLYLTTGKIKFESIEQIEKLINEFNK